MMYQNAFDGKILGTLRVPLPIRGQTEAESGDPCLNHRPPNPGPA